MGSSARHRPRVRVASVISLVDEAATLAAAAVYAKSLPRSGAECALPDAAIKLYLRGDLGAGKTCFARGFLQALGVTRSVRSPTYSLLELYPATDFHASSGAPPPPCEGVAHLDLYRMGDPEELEALGLADLDRAGWVWLVEWPEQGRGRLPRADLDCELASHGEGRSLSVRPGTELGDAWQRAASRQIKVHKSPE
jgi:tRNA threonylcarbamoyladenosine biosynthesis protein TsaE